MVDTEKHPSAFETPLYDKKNNFTSTLPSLYCKSKRRVYFWEIKSSLYKPSSPFSIQTTRQYFLCVYVNVSICKLYWWKTYISLCIFVGCPLKSPLVLFALNVGECLIISVSVWFWLEVGHVWKPLWQFYMTSYLLYQSLTWHLQVVQRREIKTFW